MLGCGDEVIYLGTTGVMGPDTPMREDIILPLASVGKIVHRNGGDDSH